MQRIATSGNGRAPPAAAPPPIPYTTLAASLPPPSPSPPQPPPHHERPPPPAAHWLQSPARVPRAAVVFVAFFVAAAVGAMVQSGGSSALLMLPRRRTGGRADLDRNAYGGEVDALNYSAWRATGYGGSDGARFPAQSSQPFPSRSTSGGTVHDTDAALVGDGGVWHSAENGTAAKPTTATPSSTARRRPPVPQPGAGGRAPAPTSAPAAPQQPPRSGSATRTRTPHASMPPGYLSIRLPVATWTPVPPAVLDAMRRATPAPLPPHCPRHASAEAAEAASSAATLSPHASFAHLSCETCMPVFEGTLCTPGDVVNRTYYPLELAWRWPAADGPPERLPHARTMMRHIRAGGCAFWRRGVFHQCGLLGHRQLGRPDLMAQFFPRARFLFAALPPLPRGHRARGKAGLPLCSWENSAAVGDGVVDADTGLWTPRSCRLPYRFPHALLSRCLAGKRLLVTGDSLMRHFAARLVATIRGQAVSIEHESGPGGNVYTWDIDGRRDEWASYPPEYMRSMRELDVGLTGSSPPASGRFTLVRLADVRLTYLTDVLDNFINLTTPTHIVAGTNNWLAGSASYDTPPRVAAQLKHVLRRRPATAALRAFVLYETPCYTPDEIATNRTVPPYRDHEARNVRFHDFLGSAWRGKFGGSAVMSHVALGFLPNCATGRAGVASRVQDTVHFACRWHPVPLPQGITQPAASLKVTRDFDCTDHLDWTGVRLLLASVCPGEFDGDGRAEWEG